MGSAHFPSYQRRMCQGIRSPLLGLACHSYALHSLVPRLSLQPTASTAGTDPDMLAGWLCRLQDTSKDNQIVTFCTGVRAGDTLMPMWCGTDYDHELAMKCSTYYNM